MTRTTAKARLAPAESRRMLAASVLGSGAVFLEGSVVNVALPALARDLGLGLIGLQWVVSGYLLTLSALMLFGGSLGDRYPRRRVFAIGSIGFAVTCVGCALAPNAAVLVAARLVQGAAGALLVPNSLALLEESFEGEARGTAIGRWAAWSAVSTAAGPLLGGLLVDRGSWRWVFASVVPLAAAAAWMTLRPVSKDAPAARPSPDATPRSRGRLDILGAALATLGLGALVAALGEAPRRGALDPLVLSTGAFGIVLLVLFPMVERRAERPILPLEVFRSRQFVGANTMTLLVYAGLSGFLFLLTLQLQSAMGYRPIAAGAALLPVNALMLVISPRVGRLAHRIGPRIPMAAGSVVAALGLALFSRVRPGASYLSVVLPAAIVFGLGLSTLVAPLTGAVLSAVGERLAGAASAVNNAVARLAGLLATIVIPMAAGIGGASATSLSGAAVDAGFPRATWITAALCAAGGVVAWLTISDRSAATPASHSKAKQRGARGRRRSSAAKSR